MTDETMVEEFDETALPGAEDEEQGEAPAETPKAKSPYAGLSAHQRNRRLALEKYGDPNDPRTTSGRNDFRLVFTNAEDRTRATEELKPKARMTKSGQPAIGGDRYLMWVKQQGFPDGMYTIEWPEDRQARLEEARAAREAEKAEQKAQREKDREANKAAKAEVRAANAKARKSKKAKKEEAEAAAADTEEQGE